MSEPAIPLKWIQNYFESLVNAAKLLEHGPFQEAVIRRAEIVADMVEEWKKQQT